MDADADHAGYQPSISADGATSRTPAGMSTPRRRSFEPWSQLISSQYFVFGPSAPCTQHAATITITATDPDDAVSSVTLSHLSQRRGLDPGDVECRRDHLARRSTWSDAWSTGQITYWVVGRDSNGNVSQPFFPDAGFILGEGDCIL